MHAEILTIGDEVVSGQLLDTNTQWLSQRLAEGGIRVLYHSSIGDELEPLAAAFRHAISRADLVVATGGLGPTTDDLTREALAKATGRPLELNQQALEHLRRLFARRKRGLPARNELQAWFPQGSRVVANPHGTAPGIDLDVPRAGLPPCRVIALPGVPAEMQEMWHGSLADLLRGLGAGGRTIRFKQLKCFGAGESQIEAMLPENFLRSQQPPVGITASAASIIFRISGEGANAEECSAAMAPIVATLRRCLGTLVFGEDDDELQHAVVRLLRQHRKTLAVCDFGTAGLVAQWLGGVDEAEGCFLGGIAVPDGAALERALALPPDLAGEDLRTAAASCRDRFAADYALAVGRLPAFEQNAADAKPVLFALATADGTTVKEMPLPFHPALKRVYCAKQALNMVRLTLTDKKP